MYIKQVRWETKPPFNCIFRFAYGPADTIVTHCLLLQESQIGFGFTFLVPAHLGSPGQNPESHKMVVVVAVVVVAVFTQWYLSTRSSADAEGLYECTMHHKYEISHLNSLAIGEWPSGTLKVITIAAIRQAIYMYLFLLVACCYISI